MDMQKQNALDIQHAKCPKPGDYWHEMFMPVCVVIGVIGNIVVFCKNTVPTDDDHWTWNLDVLEAEPINMFNKWLQYSSENMKDKYWAMVVPGSHMWAVEYLEKSEKSVA